MTEKQKRTAGPWKPCRSHEMFDGPMYDIEPDEAADYEAKPYVRIVAAGDEYVAAAHDLLAALKDMAEFSNGRCRVCGCGFDDGYCGCEPNADDVINRRREAAIAAIAKAEGRND